MSASMIEFILERSKSGVKTATWMTRSRHDRSTLGEVRWFGRWRGYAFFPAVGSAFDARCMREIADFAESETKAHHANNRARRRDAEAMSL